MRLQIMASDLAHGFAVERQADGTVVVSMPLETDVEDLVQGLQTLCTVAEIAEIADLWSEDDTLRTVTSHGDWVIVSNQPSSP